jgi:hypothetical protein
MRLSPISTGLDALRDSTSHPLSLLQALVPADSPRVENPSFDRPREDALRVGFDYCANGARTEVLIDLVQSREIPREFAFSINRKMARRRIQFPGYQQSLEDGGRCVRLEDPLDGSVRAFVQGLDAVRAGRLPESTAEVGRRMALIETLVAAFLKAERTS